jgi:hypothetical protein
VAAFAGTAILAVAVTRLPPAAPRAAVAGACTAGSLNATVSNAVPQSAVQEREHRIYLLEFTNTSNQACVLTGYPMVTAFTGLREIGSPAAFDTSVHPMAVTLEPRGTAHAELRYTTTDAFQHRSCQPVDVPELRIYPPAQHEPLVLKWRAPVCSRPGPKFLEVQPVQPRDGYSGPVS